MKETNQVFSNREREEFKPFCHFCAFGNICESEKNAMVFHIKNTQVTIGNSLISFFTNGVGM